MRVSWCILSNLNFLTDSQNNPLLCITVHGLCGALQILAFKANQREKIKLSFVTFILVASVAFVRV